jgi:hypothetical protein
MIISSVFKAVVEALTTKISLAVAWEEVYGVNRAGVLKAS